MAMVEMRVVVLLALAVVGVRVSVVVVSGGWEAGDDEDPDVKITGCEELM